MHGHDGFFVLASSRLPGRPSMRKRRALVFDQEEIVLYLFKNLFTTLGYDVLTFAEPAICPLYHDDADACGQEHACADVMFTALKMPRMTGVEFLELQAARGCRMTGGNKALISESIDENNHRRLETLGSAFFQKPVDFAAVSNWLASCEKRIDLARPLATRRKQERRTTNYKITCTKGGNDDILQATVIDISKSGLCIRLENPLLTGQEIRIGTGLPHGCRSARVVWVSQNADGTYLAGLVCD